MADEAKDGEGGEAVVKKGEDSAGAPAGGGPNQKLVFIVLILNSVVLALLAGVVWKSYVASSHQVSLTDVAAPADGSVAPEGDAHGGGGEHGGGEGKEGAPGKEGGGHGGKEGDKKGAVEDNFIYESFTVNLADSRSSHFASIDVAIEVEDPNAKEQVTRLKPKIRDFINVVLSSKTYEQIESVDGREFLREEIRNKINGYLTRGQIKNIFFTKFVIQ